jgi:hypothetical protein
MLAKDDTARRSATLPIAGAFVVLEVLIALPIRDRGRLSPS